MLNWEDLIRGMLEDGASDEEIEGALSEGEEETFNAADGFLTDEEGD